MFNATVVNAGAACEIHAQMCEIFAFSGANLRFEKSVNYKSRS